jgi:hypothetical protein
MEERLFVLRLGRATLKRQKKGYSYLKLIMISTMGYVLWIAELIHILVAPVFTLR